MTATGADRRFYAGARVRIVDGAHSGRVGRLLTAGQLGADLVHIELDSTAPHPRGAFVRIRLQHVVPE